MITADRFLSSGILASKEGVYMDNGAIIDKMDFLMQFAEILRAIPEEDARQAGAYVLGFMNGVRTVAETRALKSA